VSRAGAYSADVRRVLVGVCGQRADDENWAARSKGSTRLPGGPAGLAAVLRAAGIDGHADEPAR